MSATIPPDAANWNRAEHGCTSSRLIPLPAPLSGWACTPELARIWAAYLRGDLDAPTAKARCHALIQAELDALVQAPFDAYNADAWIDYPVLTVCLNTWDAAAPAESDILTEITVRERLQASDDILTTRIGERPTSPSFRQWAADRERVRKARRLLAENGLPIRNTGGWLVWSGRNTYRVTDDLTCDCPAGQHETACKHVELVLHTANAESPYADLATLAGAGRKAA